MTTSLQLTNHLSFGVEPLVHSGELSALLLRPHHPMHVLVASGLAQLTYKVAPLVVVVPLLIVGLDVIGGHLTEINVTSPTCMVEIAAQQGFDVAALVIDKLEQACAG